MIKNTQATKDTIGSEINLLEKCIEDFKHASKIKRNKELDEKRQKLSNSTIEEKKVEVPEGLKQTITITYGDMAENHRGMQKIGQLASEGFSIEDLEAAKKKFEAKGCKCELIDLNDILKGINKRGEPAAILIARKAIDLIHRDLSSDKFLNEQKSLNWDKKAFMYGRVVDKKARSNLCYGEESQEPDYSAGKGRVVAFKDIPSTSLLRKLLEEFLGSKGAGLVAEGNYYYDVKQCGIGFHGDTE